MSQDTNKTGRVSARLDPELDANFTAAAAIAGRTRSEAAREAIAAFVTATIRSHDDCRTTGAARNA